MELFVFLIDKSQSCLKSDVLLMKLKVLVDYLISWFPLFCKRMVNYDLIVIAFLTKTKTKVKTKKVKSSTSYGYTNFLFVSYNI